MAGLRLSEKKLFATLELCSCNVSDISIFERRVMKLFAATNAVSGRLTGRACEEEKRGGWFWIDSFSL